MTRRAVFSQAELERVLRALKAVGETVTAVERPVEGGFVVLTAGSPPPANSPGQGDIAWDKAMDKWRRSA